VYLALAFALLLGARTELEDLLRCVVQAEGDPVGASSAAFAQQQTANIYGKVSDQAGAALPGVTVILDTSEAQQVQVTNAQGEFRFFGLAPATYNLKAELQGFATVEYPKIVVNVGRNTNIEVTLHTSAEEPSPAGAVSIPAFPPPRSSPPPSSPALPPAPLGPTGLSAPELLEPPATIARTAADRAVMRVFYATDRQRRSKGVAPARLYLTERRKDDALELGVCDVSIPINHQHGVLERPSIMHLEFSGERRGKHVVLLRVVPKAEAGFLSALRDRVRADPFRQLLVFVHGFNTSFAEAAERTAQIAYDLGFEGAPVLYSWPSRESPSPRAYVADEATVDWTWPHFQEFLRTLAQRTQATHIYIVAHSMGSRVATRAVNGLVQSRSEGAQLVKEFILAAPDIDSGELRHLSASLRSAANRVTLYANSKDKAIQLSHKAHDAPRAGESGELIFLANGIDTIDASGTDTSFIQHSYYANTVVLADLKALLNGDTPPPRPHMREQLRGSQRFWLLEPHN
jgi:esterase/lipase superfamily enzyme